MPNSQGGSPGGLFNTVVEAIRSKKGEQIVSLDLSGIETSIAHYFIITHGASTVQTRAIAEAIEEQVARADHKKPYHREGYENSFWILLDYGEIIIHVFQKPYRDFYNLEELWADGHMSEL
ncbi:MAG: ribosome silencing factor [Bacteroidales bacterium]